MKPLAIDLFCGLGGWTEGLQAEGWQVIGIDNEAHVYGEHCYPGNLVLADVRALHGAWFKDADLIVASPPCQAYSYMAMPWKLGKAKAAAIRADVTGEALAGLNELFNTCFRIQREASAAAGRHIPVVVENVKGAQPWVGRAAAHYGSFYLWGDVPALMPTVLKAQKFNPDGTGHGQGSWFAIADSKERGARKNSGGSWFAVAHNTTSGKGQNPDGRKLPGFRFDGSGRSFQSASVDGVKVPGLNWNDRTRKGQAVNTVAQARIRDQTGISSRKFASAMIAKIPLALSRHIGATFYPKTPSRLRTHALEAAAVASPDDRRCPSATLESSEC